MNTPSRNSMIGLAAALAAAALAPATASAAAPTCSNMSVGVPHNAATPIFIQCSGGSGTGSPDVLIVSNPGKGALSVAAGGTSTDQWVIYTPTAGQAGADSFTYRGVSPGSGTAGADELGPVQTVELRIAPGSAPVCASLSQSVPQATATNLRLVCATGGDPVDAYTVVDGTDHGTLGLGSINSGLLTYTSQTGFSGADAFTYRLATRCNGPTGPVCTSGAATYDLMVLDPQQGPAGPAGPQGPAGGTGAQGPQGPTGAAGATGAQGAAGAAGAQGPAGPAGATGGQGPAGAAGARGPAGAVTTTPRLMVASFLDALTARSGRSVLLRYVATTDARVILEVFKGKRRVASVPGRAREGRNAIRWNGKAGRKAAPAGTYRLVLRATSGGQAVSDSATVRVTGGSSRSRGGGGGGGTYGGGGGGGSGGGDGGAGAGEG